MAYETLLVETRDRVGLVTLNRPKALNAINSTVVSELNAALKAFALKTKPHLDEHLKMAQDLAGKK